MFLSQRDHKSEYNFNRYRRGAQANAIHTQIQLKDLSDHCESHFSKGEYSQCIIDATKALKLIAAHPQKFTDERSRLLYFRAQANFFTDNYAAAVQDARDHKNDSGSTEVIDWVRAGVDNYYAAVLEFFDNDNLKEAVAYAKKGKTLASALGMDDPRFDFFIARFECSGEMVVRVNDFEKIKDELLRRAEKELKQADYSTAISLTTEALVVCRDTKNADDAKVYFLRSLAYHLRSKTKKTPDAKNDHKQAVDDGIKDAACDQKNPDYQLYKKEIEKALGLTLTV